MRSGWGAFWIIFPTRAGTFSDNSFKSSQASMLNLGDGAGSGAGASRENAQSTRGCWSRRHLGGRLPSTGSMPPSCYFSFHLTCKFSLIKAAEMRSVCSEIHILTLLFSPCPQWFPHWDVIEKVICPDHIQLKLSGKFGKKDAITYVDICSGDWN